MTNPFYESEVVRGEVQEMEQLYLELAKLSVKFAELDEEGSCLLYTSPSPRDKRQSRMPSSA